MAGHKLQTKVRKDCTIMEKAHYCFHIEDTMLIAEPSFEALVYALPCCSVSLLTALRIWVSLPDELTSDQPRPAPPPPASCSLHCDCSVQLHTWPACGHSVGARGS